MHGTRGLTLGGVRPLDGSGETQAFTLPSEHLLTHGVVVGMTGSGKTGLLMVLVEEALRSAIPVIMIDIKGDLPNLLLTFPNVSAEEFAPWMDEGHGQDNGQSQQELAQREAQRWQQWLAEWELGPSEVAQLHDSIAPRVFTPGLVAGEPLHILSSLEQPSSLWTTDLAAARESLSAAISLLLRLTGRDPDPTRSRDHVVLSVFAERRLREGHPADVASLLEDVRKPPIEKLGAMPIEEFLPKRDRLSLATALNTLLASPTFESWRTGAPLDVASWVAPRPDGRTPAVIVSVAHLDDDERALVLGILLDQAQVCRGCIAIDSGHNRGPIDPTVHIEVADALATMPGVVAVVLGGSRALGSATVDSDWDLGVYYRAPLDLSALSRLGHFYPPGSWGRIMNGGAWLTVRDTKVDVLLRDLATVEHWSARAAEGVFEIDALLGYVAGAPTYSLLAERAVAVPLRGRLDPVVEYPRRLAEAAPGRKTSPRWQALSRPGRSRLGRSGCCAQRAREHAYFVRR
jgi:hypothetical protein